MNRPQDTPAKPDGHPLLAIRAITRATDVRTIISAEIPLTAVGNSAAVVEFASQLIVAQVLVAANLNSLPLDWAARFKVAGINLNFFYLRQFPILPPDVYADRIRAEARTWVELIAPRVLELTYVSDDMAPYALALGYDGPPFEWDEVRRHRVQSELDAIYACMYGLHRAELEWILDPQPPSISFPSLKQHETAKFGEYRTRRLVLEAYDRFMSA